MYTTTIAPEAIKYLVKSCILDPRTLALLYLIENLSVEAVRTGETFQSYSPYLKVFANFSHISAILAA